MSLCGSSHFLPQSLLIMTNLSALESATTFPSLSDTAGFSEQRQTSIVCLSFLSIPSAFSRICPSPMTSTRPVVLATTTAVKETKSLKATRERALSTCGRRAWNSNRTRGVSAKAVANDVARA